MENPLADKWQTRDFPVLLRAAADLDDGQDVDLERIQTEVGVDEDTALRALTTLIHAGYLAEDPHAVLTLGDGPGAGLLLTERGRRAVGIWPGGNATDVLVDALRQAEDATTDPEEKTLLRRAAGAVASLGQDVLADVMAAVIRQQTGI